MFCTFMFMWSAESAFNNEKSIEIKINVKRLIITR